MGTKEEMRAAYAELVMDEKALLADQVFDVLLNDEDDCADLIMDICNVFSDRLGDRSFDFDEDEDDENEIVTYTGPPTGFVDRPERGEGYKGPWSH